MPGRVTQKQISDEFPYFFSTHNPRLSLSDLIMYFTGVNKVFIRFCSCLHQEVVLDGQDKILQLLGYLRSPPLAIILACVRCASVFSPSLVIAWHFDKCVTVKSVNNGSIMNPYTICWQWTASLRQTERKEETTKWCAVYFRRYDKLNSLGSSAAISKSMNESWHSLIGSRTRGAWWFPQSADVNTAPK